MVGLPASRRRRSPREPTLALDRILKNRLINTWAETTEIEGTVRARLGIRLRPREERLLARPRGVRRGGVATQAGAPYRRCRQRTRPGGYTHRSCTPHRRFAHTSARTRGKIHPAFSLLITCPAGLRPGGHRTSTGRSPEGHFVDACASRSWAWAQLSWVGQYWSILVNRGGLDGSDLTEQ
jgi:hypothetical protein